MSDSRAKVESYVQRRFSWFRRWRVLLIICTIVVWLPVLFLLQWKLQVLEVLQQQGFYWLPGIDGPDLSLWQRWLLKLTYDLEYYTQILMRVIAVGAAVSLATTYTPVVAGRGGDRTRIYLDYRHAVRRAVYWAMLMFLLLPSLVAQLIREAGITREGIDPGVIGFPLFLLVADWFSQCEVQQWLILHFRRLRRSGIFGLTLLLTAAYFYANYYMPQTEHWGRLSITPLYPNLVKGFLLGFSALTAILWRQHTATPTAGMQAEIERKLNEPGPELSSTDGTAGGVPAAGAQPRAPWLTRTAMYYAAAVIAVLGIVFAMVVRSGVLHDPDIYPNPDRSIPVISTRGQFYSGKLIHQFTPYEYQLEDPANRLPAASAEPGDLLVIVHGFNNDPLRAQYKFDMAQSAAEACGYAGCLAGFSWDADTNHDPLSATGYSTGDSQAAKNGPKLARFVSDFKRDNPNTRVHLVGYSMGARVVLEAVYSMATDPVLANDGAIVDTVHLLGASVDSEEVEVGERYGAALEARVRAVYNYFSRKDVALAAFYWIKESDRSLGEMCIEHPAARPANYHSVNAEAELVSFDEKFRPVPEKTGDNHKAYLGAKDDKGNLLDNGVLDLILANIAALPAE